MDFFNFLSGLNWDILKNKLIANWVSAEKLQGVDFNNIQDLNKLAEDIMPGIIKQNPYIANLIKQSASSLSKEKAEEVVQVIDAA